MPHFLTQVGLSYAYPSGVSAQSVYSGYHYGLIPTTLLTPWAHTSSFPQTQSDSLHRPSVIVMGWPHNIDKETLDRWKKMLAMERENICENFNKISSAYECNLANDIAQGQANYCLVGTKSNWVALFSMLTNPVFNKKLSKIQKYEGNLAALKFAFSQIAGFCIPSVLFNGIQGMIMEYAENYIKTGSVPSNMTNTALNCQSLAGGLAFGITANCCMRLVYLVWLKVYYWWKGLDSNVTLKSMFETDIRGLVEFVFSTSVQLVASYSGNSVVNVLIATTTAKLLLSVLCSAYAEYKKDGLLALLNVVGSYFKRSSNDMAFWELENPLDLEAAEYRAQCEKEIDSAEIELTCPISYELMVEPVILTCGHIFDEQNLMRALSSQPISRCPLCRVEVPLTSRLPAIEHKKVIEEYAKKAGIVLKK